MPAVALAVVGGGAAVTVLAGWGYFRRYLVSRPPFGLLNLYDIGLMLAIVALLPYLYLHLPPTVVSLLLGVTVLATLHLTLEPVVPGRAAAWAACLALMAIDVALAFTVGSGSAWFLALNDAIMVLIVVGAANLWAQSGMQARDVAALAAALAVYDLVATAWLPVMTEVLERLSRLPHLPFYPLVGWGSLDHPEHALRLGLGDLLLIAVFPVVMRRAFGRTAGIVAMATGLAVIAATLTLVATGWGPRTVPVMVPLGPLMVAQYAFHRRGNRGERTTWQYLRAEAPNQPVS